MTRVVWKSLVRCISRERQRQRKRESSEETGFVRGWGGCLTIKPGPWPATIFVLFFILRGQSCYVSNPVARSSHFCLHLGSPSFTWTSLATLSFILSWAFNSAWLEFGWAHPLYTLHINIYIYAYSVYIYIYMNMYWVKTMQAFKTTGNTVSNKHKAPYRRSKYKNRMFQPQRQQRNTLFQEF